MPNHILEAPSAALTQFHSITTFRKPRQAVNQAANQAVYQAVIRVTDRT